MSRIAADAGRGEVMTMNFGPQHPATHGTLHVTLRLDGETILDADPEIGFLHSGFEKLAEYRNFNQWVTVTDRMNYMSPLCNNIGFSLAVEKLLGIEVPPRARAIRILLAELTRIADHIVCNGLQAMDLGAFSAFLYAFELREKLYDLFEEVTGTRLTTSYTRVGGLARDLPPEAPARIGRLLDGIPKVLSDVGRLLDSNRIWLDRTRGVGVLSREDAISWGITGPMLRASGVPLDLRKSEPYGGYEAYEFDIPVGETGDVLDRYLVRMEEIRQSVRICRQVLESLPAGEVSSVDPKLFLPDKPEVWGKMESLIHHFKLIMPGHGFEVPKGEVYQATESPNGELGFFVVSDGTFRPWRVRVRPPSFVNFSIFSRLARGRLIADAVAILGSINVIAGELDR